MPYCTLDDIKKLVPEAALVQLTDDEAAGSVNSARVDEAIAQADAEVDSYLSVRHGVPLDSPAPVLVRKLSVDLAVYNLYSRTTRDVPEVRAERYRNAIRTLEGIAAGTSGIGGLSEADDQAGSASESRPGGGVFTRGSLGGF